MSYETKRKAVLELFKEGLNIRDISCYTGVRYGEIKRLCSKADKTNRPRRGPKPKFTPEMVDFMIKMRPTKTLREIGETFGISKQRVFHLIRRRADNET